jgi:hypothetical protein
MPTAANTRSRRPLAPLLASLLLLGGAVLLVGISLHHLRPLASRLFPMGGKTEVAHSVVVEQVRSVARLVTSETSVRDVVVYENRRLGSTKRSLVVVSGKVMAGFDLDAGTQVDVDHRERQVSVVLPPAAVLGVEITNLRTYDEQSGLWNPFRPADRDTIYHLARQQLIRAATDLRLTGNAEESARRLLQAMIHADGYTVNVAFGSAPKPSTME